MRDIVTCTNPRSIKVSKFFIGRKGDDIVMQSALKACYETLPFPKLSLDFKKFEKSKLEKLYDTEGKPYFDYKTDWKGRDYENNRWMSVERMQEAREAIRDFEKMMYEKELFFFSK